MTRIIGGKRATTRINLICISPPLGLSLASPYPANALIVIQSSVVPEAIIVELIIYLRNGR
jgi:hypothetical protein